MIRFVSKLLNLCKAIFYALDWGFNPTHTKSAIQAAEIYLNNKTKYPQIEAMMNKNPEIYNQLNSPEFADDMSKPWNITTFKQTYGKGTLGYDYAIFMEQLGFEALGFNLSDTIPVNIRNILNLGVRNHDLVHFLFGLYDADSQGNLVISDFHEWIFLFYTTGTVASGQKFLPNILLFPSFLKALFTGNRKRFFEARTIGAKMSGAANLNLMWLKPYFNSPKEEVMNLLRVQTMSAIIASKNA